MLLLLEETSVDAALDGVSGKAGQASPGCRWVEPATQQLEGGGSVFDDGDAAVKRRVWVEGRGPGFVLDFVKWRVVASKHMIEFEYELSTERRKSGSAGAELGSSRSWTECGPGTSSSSSSTRPHRRR